MSCRQKRTKRAKSSKLDSTTKALAVESVLPRSDSSEWRIPVSPSKWHSLTNGAVGFLLPPLYWDPGRKWEGVAWSIGLDVHRDTIWIAIYGQEQIHFQQKILGPIAAFPRTEAGFRLMIEMMLSFSPTRCVMETTGIYSFFPYHTFRKIPNLTSATICMNAQELSRFLVQNKKTDKIDAARLAQIGSMPELIKPSYIPPQDEYVLRSMLRQRNKYNNEATRYKNRIKSLLLAGGFGWYFTFGGGEEELLRQFISASGSIHEWLAQLKPAMLSAIANNALMKQRLLLAQWSTYRMEDLEKMQFRLLFAMKDRMEGQVEFLDKFLQEQVLARDPHRGAYAHIKDIPGFGIWAILTVILETGPIQRFPNIAAYLSYCGISNGLANSAEKEQKKGPNPHSCHMLKKAYRTVGFALLNSLQRAKDQQSMLIHPVYQYAAQLWAKKMENGQRAHKMGAKVARIVYHLLTHNIDYDLAYEHRQSLSSAEINHMKQTKLLVRYTYYNELLMKLSRNYEDIFRQSGLDTEPEFQKLIGQFDQLLNALPRDRFCEAIRLRTKEIRTIRQEHSENK